MPNPPDCSHPHCDNPATAQWQRIAGDGETAAPLSVIAERVALEDELRRSRQRLAIRELETIRLDPDFNPDLLAGLDNQIRNEQAALEAMVPTVVGPQPERPTLIAVHGCDEHAIDADAAARLHEAGCMSGGFCGCVTGPNPLEVPMTAELAERMAA